MLSVPVCVTDQKHDRMRLFSGGITGTSASQIQATQSVVRVPKRDRPGFDQRGICATLQAENKGGGRAYCSHSTPVPWHPFQIVHRQWPPPRVQQCIHPCDSIAWGAATKGRTWLKDEKLAPVMSIILLNEFTCSIIGRLLSLFLYANCRDGFTNLLRSIRYILEGRKAVLFKTAPLISDRLVHPRGLHVRVTHLVGRARNEGDAIHKETIFNGSRSLFEWFRQPSLSRHGAWLALSPLALNAMRPWNYGQILSCHDMSLTSHYQ